MNEERVRVRVDAQGVAEVAMVRTEKMNALDPAMFEALAAAIAQVGADPAVRAVVLHGEGRAFCAGLDKASLEGTARESSSIGDLLPRTHGAANRWQHVAWGWRDVPVPVIAAIHGAAFGGGLQVALGADVRIVHPQAQLSVMEIKWGLVPDMAGCALLADLVRGDVARELVFSGRIVLGEEAVALGLATRTSNGPLEEARRFALQVASSSPDAVRAAKRLLNRASPVDVKQVLAAEAEEQQRLIGSANQREAVAAGLAKRPPRFR